MSWKRRPRSLSGFRATIAGTLMVAACLVVAGCAGRDFMPRDPSRASFVERTVSESDGPVRVRAAVPDAAETEALFGISLYDQGIQPVWLEIENASKTSLRAALWSIDPDYYSPLELAWMNRQGFSKQGRADLDRWFYDTAMKRRIPPGEVVSGFVYTLLLTLGYVAAASSGDSGPARVAGIGWFPWSLSRASRFFLQLVM